MQIIKAPLSETRAIQNIFNSVSHLIVPELSLLSLLLLDLKTGINSEKAQLRKLKEQAKNEGYAAAMRLMMPNDSQLEQAKGTYFERLENGQRR